MKFSLIAEAFEHISRTSSRTEIMVLLAELLKKSTPDEAEFITYFSLGMVTPPYENTNLNVAQKTIAALLAELFNLSLSQVKADIKKAGDIGLYAELYVKEYPLHGEYEAPLMIEDVKEVLQELAREEGSGSQLRRKNAIIELLKKADPTEIKYILRSLIGTLRLGFSEMTLLDALSWMCTSDKSLKPLLENYYNICADIGKVAKTVKMGGGEDLDGYTIVPGIPLRPAAAERAAHAEEVFERVGKGAIAQPKLDGFRLQIHIFIDESGRKQVSFFSRNLRNISYMFPEMTTFFKEKVPVSSAILDAEAIAYSAQTGDFLPFQETVKRRRKHNIKEVLTDFPLKLYLFDLLYYQKESLLSHSHEERRKLLESFITPYATSDIQAIEEYPITSVNDITICFEEALSKGLEGLVIKKTDAPYKAGKRNFNWIKLKRSQDSLLDDTIDCVILGYYAGSGKRAAFGIGALLVGVYDPENDEFHTIAKIGTGLSDSEWSAYKGVCDKHKVKEKPTNVVCKKELFPDVWVEPSVVCMVRADDISKSPLHTAAYRSGVGYALRFPRLMGERPDKKAQQTTSPEEIIRLYSLQNLKR